MKAAFDGSNGSLHFQRQWKLPCSSMEASTDLHESASTSPTSNEMYMEVNLLPPTSMEASMEVGGRRFTSMYISLEVGEVDALSCKSVEASMEEHGSFHCRWKCKLPLLPSNAAFTNIFRGRFHELQHTPTYFHLLPRASQTSGCFHTINPSPNPKLELPPWKLT